MTISQVFGKHRFSRSNKTTQYVADFSHVITEEYRVNKDFGSGEVSAGRIFTESYDVKGENLPTDTNPVL